MLRIDHIHLLYLYVPIPLVLIPHTPHLLTSSTPHLTPTQVEEGWCEGLLEGRRGLFPENFVEIQPASSSKPATSISGEQSNVNMNGSSALRGRE